MNVKSTTTTRTGVVTHITQTGSAFGTAIGGNGEGIFIPVAVATSGFAKAGQVFRMETIPNPAQLGHDKTPLMCTHMTYIGTDGVENAIFGKTPAVTADEARAFTNDIMKSGVWTNGEIFRELIGPDAKREDNVAAYSAIGNELRRMFSADQCVKFTMYRTATQTKASAEWYTCAADVEPCEMVEE